MVFFQEKNMFGVSQKKEKALRERMERLGIKEEDIIEHFVHSRGKGGQKVNKSMTCVYLKHLPSQIEVKCDKTRFQSLNRFLARRILVEKLESLLFGESEKIKKIRKQKRKAYKRAKKKLARS